MTSSGDDVEQTNPNYYLRFLLSFSLFFLLIIAVNSTLHSPLHSIILSHISHEAKSMYFKVERTVQNLITSNRTQSLVFHGRKGSGKTQLWKTSIQYLLVRLYATSTEYGHGFDCDIFNNKNDHSNVSHLKYYPGAGAGQGADPGEGSPYIYEYPNTLICALVITAQQILDAFTTSAHTYNGSNRCITNVAFKFGSHKINAAHQKYQGNGLNLNFLYPTASQTGNPNPNPNHNATNMVSNTCIKLDQEAEDERSSDRHQAEESAHVNTSTHGLDISNLNSIRFSIQSLDTSRVKFRKAVVGLQNSRPRFTFEIFPIFICGVWETNRSDLANIYFLKDAQINAYFIKNEGLDNNVVVKRYSSAFKSLKQSLTRVCHFDEEMFIDLCKTIAALIHLSR